MIRVLIGLLCTLGFLALGLMLEGAFLDMFLQPVALAIVFGGATSALLVAFPPNIFKHCLVSIKRGYSDERNCNQVINVFGSYQRFLKAAGMISFFLVLMNMVDKAATAQEVYDSLPNSLMVACVGLVYAHLAQLLVTGPIIESAKNKKQRAAYYNKKNGRQSFSQKSNYSKPYNKQQ